MRGEPPDYVLSDFTADEAIVMDRALDQAVAAVETFIASGIRAAMNSTMFPRRTPLRLRESRPRRSTKGHRLNLSGLLPAIQKAAPVCPALKKLWTPEGGASAFTMNWGLLEGARPAVLAALQQDWLGPVLVLAAQPERARFLQEQVGLW